MRVLEVIPPEPPKLLEMAQAVLDYDEDLPPIELSFDPIDLRELAAAHPAQHYLFPCRCSGLDAGARVDFLDAGPPEAAEWTLVGCERSRQIHVELYGREPSARVDFCPRALVDGDGPTLLKCCLAERGIERVGIAHDCAVGSDARGSAAGSARTGGGRAVTVYDHLWTTEETRALFDDRGRTQSWLDIIAALAGAQAELDLIPEAAARDIAAHARVEGSTSRPWRRRRVAAGTPRSG